MGEELLFSIVAAVDIGEATGLFIANILTFFLPGPHPEPARQHYLVFVPQRARSFVAFISDSYFVPLILL